jgi:Cu+-exporting ATPase
MSEPEKLEIKNKKNEKLICVHCGDVCPDDSIAIGDKYFCCNGCKFVYEMLHESELSEFYELAGQNGIKPNKIEKDEFEFLDEPKVAEKLIKFSGNGKSKITLFLPEIYCSACLMLLENINRMDQGILEARVNFLKKEISILFDNHDTSVRKIVELLTSLGYKPQLNLSEVSSNQKKNYQRSLYIKLGIAGFAFGNVMLFALPDYFAAGKVESYIADFLAYISMVLIFPVLYAASDYFRSAYKSLTIKKINIDVPISLGITVLVIRSMVDIIGGFGQGYVDSLAGLVFFLLIGKVFQQKTYHNLSFDRDYKSYFPLSVIKINNGEKQHIPVKDIKLGDKLQIRNGEIIPADSVMMSELGSIDYSFVTGESDPVEIKNGEKIYSGGKLVGHAVEVEVIKDFDQSYLTELWNDQAFDQNRDKFISNISDTAAKYFTFVVLIIAIATLFYWLPIDTKIALDSFTAVLIIACPCALALTIPFTYGTVMRIFGKNDLYIKNDKVVEVLSKVNRIVFDKTGTLTYTDKSKPEFIGEELNDEDTSIIKAVVANSTHPLSRIIHNSLIADDLPEVKGYSEEIGLGIEATVHGKLVKVGKLDFVATLLSKKLFNEATNSDISPESKVYISFDNDVLGYFVIRSVYRESISELMQKLKTDHKIEILSGDNPSEKEILEKLIGNDVEMKFKQLPGDKLKEIEKNQKNGDVILMIGDGLNDAGAIARADSGFVITENTSSFTPGSDGILLAKRLNGLPKLLKLSKLSITTVWISYIISFLYNIIGFSFAVQGLLSPVVAAILMPVSSISVVEFIVAKVKFDAKRINLK